MDESTTIIVYAITEKGPDIVHVKTALPNSKIQEIALYHLLLVAQGTWHHEGVFILPIPVAELSNTSKAIFYGFKIFDPDQKDPRTNQTRYCCIIVFCSNEILSDINIIDFEQKMDDFVGKLKCYQDLKNPSFFTSIQNFSNQNIFQKKKINHSQFSIPNQIKIH